MVPCRVQLLDGTDYEVDVEKKDVGEALMEKVCEKLNLAERDYFGLTFEQNNIKFWLNLTKEIDKQIKKGPWLLAFELKFYPNPNTLHEEITRYQVFLQVRRDVLNGRLPCSFITSALLGSYAVQSELGDYEAGTHGNGFDYIKTMQFTKSQNEELLEKIAELHRIHNGQNPSEAELYYLDNAKNLSLYGVHLHDAKASDGDDVMIGVCAAGLLVFKDKLRIHRYTWPKILKIRYKRNNFFIDIRPEPNERKAGLDTYKLETVKMAKRLWRIAVEHHAFFRLREPENAARTKFSRAPYRYSGRTQYQAQRAVTQDVRPGQPVNRANAPQFSASRSTENVALGYSTERWEKHTVDEYQTATLDLRNQRSGGSLADIDASQHDATMDGHVSLLAGGYGAAYIARSVNGSQGQPTGDPRWIPGAANNQQNYIYEGSNHDAASAVSHQSRQSRQSRPRNGGAGGPGPVSGPYQPTLNGRPASRADSSYSDASSALPAGYAQPPPRRKHVSSRSSQSSRNDRGPATNGGFTDEEPGYATIMDTPSSGWRAQSSATSPKTTTRTYTAEDGSLITEYRTERNGVIETHIEKRTRVASVPEEETFDYDRALADAIHAVTDMNPDMSVQKIEIHTRSQEV